MFQNQNTFEPNKLTEAQAVALRMFGFSPGQVRYLNAHMHPSSYHAIINDRVFFIQFMRDTDDESI